MKAITLYQPHATLMAIGAKMIETRPRPWKHLGLVAIHAGLSKKWLPLCFEEPFVSVLKAAGYLRDKGASMETGLPFGKVIAIGNKVGCMATDLINTGSHGTFFRTMSLPITDQERAFGNYAPGRFGYGFSETRKLDEPIPYSGHQGCWDLPIEWCDGCDGTGLMEGWNRRDGYSCPKCHGNAITLRGYPRGDGTR